MSGVCNTYDTQASYIVNTLGIGISISLGIHGFITACHHTIKNPTPRKGFILAASLSLLIDAIIYSSVALNPNAQVTGNMIGVLLFGHLTTLLITCASIYRYTLFLPERKRNIVNILCCASVSIIVMYVFAVNAARIVVAPTVFTVVYGYAGFVLGIIPVGHFVLGIVAVYQGIRQKMGNGARSKVFLTLSLSFTFGILIVWVGFLVLILASIQAVGAALCLQSFVIELENNVAHLTEVSQEHHSHQASDRH